MEKRGVSEQTVAVSLIALIVLHFLLRFQGIQHQNFYNLFSYLVNPGLMTHDIFLTKSLMTETSSIYWLIQKLGIDLSNDWIGFPIYLVVGGISAIVAYFVAKEFVKPETSAVPALILLILLVYGEAKTLQTVEGSLFLTIFPSQTWFSHALAFIPVLLMLRGRYFECAIALAFLMSVYIRVHWIHLPVLGFCMLWDSKQPKWKLGYLAIPVGYILWKLMHSGRLPLTHDQLLKLCQNTISRIQFENSLDLMPLPNTAFFAVCVAAFWFLIPKMETENTRRYSKAVWCSSLIAVVLGTAYTWKLYLWFPNPFIFLLSPAVRSMELFSIILVLLSGSVVVRSSKLDAVQKVLFLVALMVLRVNIPMTGVVSALLVVGAWAWGKLPVLRNRVPVSFSTLFLLATLLMTLKPVYARRGEVFDAEGLRLFSQWSIRPLHPDLKAALSDLRQKPDDFILLPLELLPNGKVSFDGYPCHLANKSKYVGDPVNLMLNDEYFEIAKRRNEQTTEFANRLAQVQPGQRVTVPEARFLVQDQVWILANKSLLERLPAIYQVVQDYGQYVLLKP